MLKINRLRVRQEEKNVEFGLSRTIDSSHSKENSTPGESKVRWNVVVRNVNKTIAIGFEIIYSRDRNLKKEVGGKV